MNRLKIVLKLLCCAMIAAPLHPVSAQEEGTALSVVAVGGVVSDPPSLGKLDLGVVDSISMPKADIRFLLKNQGKLPVTIERLQPTCGCTSVLLGDKNETSKTLAPDEEVGVSASVDLVRFHGPITKQIRVFGKNNVLLATLQVSANVMEPAKFSARQIDFGRVTFGTRTTLALNLTLSATLLKDGALPPLESSNPNITIEPVAAKELASGTPANQRSYAISLSPRAPIGPIVAVIGFKEQPTPEATDPQAETKKRLIAALQAASIAVNGEVTGNISATPSLVVFNPEKQPKPQITLTAADGKSLKNLKVVSNSPWLLARVVPPVKATDALAKPKSPAVKNSEALPLTALIELSLKPNTPPGALQTSVTITSADGEVLSVPVLAEVVAK